MLSALVSVVILVVKLKGLHEAKFFVFLKPFFTYQPHPSGSISSLHYDTSFRLSHVSISAVVFLMLLHKHSQPGGRAQAESGLGDPSSCARRRPGVSVPGWGGLGCCSSSAGTQRQVELNRN